MNAAQKRDAVLDKSPFAELWLTVFCGRKTAVNYPQFPNLKPSVYR